MLDFAEAPPLFRLDARAEPRPLPTSFPGRAELLAVLLEPAVRRVVPPDAPVEEPPLRDFDAPVEEPPLRDFDALVEEPPLLALEAADGELLAPLDPELEVDREAPVERATPLEAADFLVWPPLLAAPDD